MHGIEGAHVERSAFATLPAQASAAAQGPEQGLRSNPDGRFQRFRIGNAVSARNTHAAIHDALWLMKDV